MSSVKPFKSGLKLKFGKFEINEKYGTEILKMLSKIGFVDIALKKDINDKDRMIKAIWK